MKLNVFLHPEKNMDYDFGCKLNKNPILLEMTNKIIKVIRNRITDEASKTSVSNKKDLICLVFSFLYFVIQQRLFCSCSVCCNFLYNRRNYNKDYSVAKTIQGEVQRLAFLKM